jgi:hypothetical protein
MNDVHPQKLVLFSLVFFLLVLILFLYCATLNFDLLFSYSFLSFNFYYSLIVYWYGMYGYYVLIGGVVSSIGYVLYSIKNQVKITRRVLFILPLSCIIGALSGFFFGGHFVDYGLVGEMGATLLRFYCGFYEKTVFYILLVLFMAIVLPVIVWSALWRTIIFIIKKSHIIQILQLLWYNFLYWVCFIFRIKNKKQYIDSLISQTVESHFKRVTNNYMIFDPVVHDESGDQPVKSYLEQYLDAHPGSLDLSTQIFGKLSEDEIYYMTEALAHFEIHGIVEKTCHGPYLNTIIFTPERHITINSIFNIQNDLGRILGRSDLRIVYPINQYPHSIAIEYSHYNVDSKIVFLPYFVTLEYAGLPPLSILLGLDAQGNPFFCNMKDMPHLLLAGTTGSGKSSILNSIIFNFIWKYTPSQVNLFLIDPKKSEFFTYQRFSMVVDIAYSIEEIIIMLQKIVKIMEERYAFLNKHHYKNIDEAIKDNHLFSYLIIIIDEYADIVLQSKVAEQLCLRLLQMARAAGIHLIIATQRPSSDILTGTLKSNLPTRIACRVINAVNSKIILDIAGAEKLLGKGDMIIYYNGKYNRVHGFYIDMTFILNLLN